MAGTKCTRLSQAQGAHTGVQHVPREVPDHTGRVFTRFLVKHQTSARVRTCNTIVVYQMQEQAFQEKKNIFKDPSFARGLESNPHFFHSCPHALARPATHSPRRLFRTLAGLDDPTEEAPSVIISRCAVQRSTRNLGGTGGGGSGGISVSGVERRGGHLTVAFGRASSVVGSISRRDHSDYSSDESSDSFEGDEERGGRGGGRGFRGRSSVESGSAADVVEHGGGSGKTRSGRFSTGGSVAIPVPAGGTWAAFSRDCARLEDAPTLSVTDAHDFRSTSGRTRRSSGGGDGSGRERRRASPRSSTDGTVAPGFDGIGGGGVGAPDSPESSTVSGLTGWRRQRLQQRVVSQRSSRRAARESGGGGTSRAAAHADSAEESKHDEGRSRSRERNARVSPRSWIKAGASGGASRPGTATKTGIKSLSALSRPSPSESRKIAAPRIAAATGTASGLSASGRSGSSGGGGRVASDDSGRSRPGTSLKDVLKARHGSGGGGGSGRQW